MKKIKNLIIGGIDNKIFNLILFTVLIISIVFTGMNIYQNRLLKKLNEQTIVLQKESIKESTSVLIENVIRENVGRSTELEAQIADDLFHSLGVRVETMEENAKKLLSDPPSSSKTLNGPSVENDGTIITQLIFSDDVKMTPALQRKIAILSNMSDMMESLFDASDVTNSLFIGLPEGAFIITDDRSAGKFKEDGTLQSYDPTSRIWYTMAQESGSLIFTDVETDAFTGDVGIVCAMPVYIDGKLEAVVGSDLFLYSMKEAVESSDENGGFLFVVNHNGHVVFSPKEEGVFAVLPSDEAIDLRTSENEDLSSIVNDAMKTKTGVRTFEVDGISYYAAGSPIGTLGWALISVLDQRATEKPVTLLQENYQQIQEEASASYLAGYKKIRTITYLILFLVLFFSLGNAIVFSKRIVKPLNTIVERISKLSDRNLEFKMEDAYKTGDEIEVLAQSFAKISHRTVNYLDQIQKVTAEKERISTELEMAKRIQDSMIPTIFPAFPDRKEFDIYASIEPAKGVGGDFYDFYLLDHDHLCMIIADVSGKGIPAALFMMACKIILQSFAMQGLSPADILTNTNRAICSNNKEGMFITVWVAILDLKTGKLTASNAGHEYPAIKRAGGKYELAVSENCPPLASTDDVAYYEETIKLNAGPVGVYRSAGSIIADAKHVEQINLEDAFQLVNVGL